MTTNDEIIRKIDEVSDRLQKIERKIFKRGLSFEAAIPPATLCRDVLVRQGQSNWDNEMQLLAEYYGVASMTNYYDPNKVPKKAIACYHKFANAAYYKKPTTTIEVVLHEFFHHLIAKGVVVLDSAENEEECADQYAKIIVAMGEV